MYARARGPFPGKSSAGPEGNSDSEIRVNKGTYILASIQRQQVAKMKTQVLTVVLVALVLLSVLGVDVQ